ncbi:MAG TPA: 1,2-phenylacetyl-CoA epoxidase subunit PaaD [Steroidobacteraceae bacterium]|jgi:ring-1,2-phenylacetyl-CoA epoxidase subunit PaaD
MAMSLGLADERIVAREREVWELLAEVPDPEIPVLSIVDLGIVRHVRLGTDGRVLVGLTPTYSGCPATEVIRSSVRTALDSHGHSSAILEEVLSPPWTSEWLTPAARRKLAAFGIAPPEEPVSSPKQLWRATVVTCPRCGSRTTTRISEFGSTPCKAHYRCSECREPFDYFKCL